MASEFGTKRNENRTRRMRESEEIINRLAISLGQRIRASRDLARATLKNRKWKQRLDAQNQDFKVE